MEKKKCFCGCDSFDVYQWEERKGDVMIKCQACKCERRITTPGISVKKYDLKPDFANKPLNLTEAS